MEGRRQVLSRKRFFLDLHSLSPSSDAVAAMVKDIEALGGVFDSFFSQDVSIVITDASESVVELHSRLHRRDKASSPLPALLPSPPSPRCLAPITRTRVDTIMERASRRAALPPKKSASSSEVIENAFRWGLKVWCVPKVINWINNYKKRMGTNDLIDRDEDASSITVLKRPYVKIDDQSGQLRPFWHEFVEKEGQEAKKALTSFPRLHFDGEFGSSPFIAGNTQMRRAMVPLGNNGQTQQKAKVVRRPRRKDGYCEVCQHNYLDLETHIASKEHVTVTHDDQYWARFDQLKNQSLLNGV